MKKELYEELKTKKGVPDVLGAALDKNGCNFAIYSQNAENIKLILFDKNDLIKPAHIIDFDKNINKTDNIWHIYIYGIKKGQYYGYSIDGSYNPERKGHRFNPNKLLIDPYSKAVSCSCNWNYSNSYGYDINSNEGHTSFSKDNNFSSAIKSIIASDNDFDWSGDRSPNTPWKDTIIYEMHVRGFTRDCTSKVKYPGTYHGVIKKIPYLKELGITAIELLPVFEFNELENNRFNPITKERLKNFWGYSPLAFFAPESWYSTKPNGLSAIIEFKQMVKALHKAGIEVILDVVYNHTGEGNEYGPTINFKGIDNSNFYMLEKNKAYKNYSGCGNTFNCNYPMVKRLIIDSLHYWIESMHVDGFRFDLAAILGRDEHGKWIEEKSLLDEINSDPVISKTKLISEPWDAGGFFKLGDFPSNWSEWNSKFKEDVRSFIKTDKNKVYDFSRRLVGSPDIFLKNKKYSYHSINYVSCHDGFTLNDVVSYNNKHNKNNGENNHDGENNNFSFNYGIEGLTDNPEVLRLRDRQMKNLFLILMISQGTPMILSGDEVKFSKNGNNNTYSHDNELNWFNWNLLKKNKDFFEYVKFIIRFRKKHPVLRLDNFIFNEEVLSGNEKSTSSNKNELITFHGVEIGKPDYKSNSHSIGLMMQGSKYKINKNNTDEDIYVAINAYWEDLTFNLPALENKKWHLCINTFSKPDFYIEGKEILIKDSCISVKQRSIVVLIGK